MKRLKGLITLLAFLVITTMLMTGCSQTVVTDQTISGNTQNETKVSTTTDTQQSSKLFGAQAAKADTDLTIPEMLTYAIQDEYLAHAEYDYVIKTFGDQRPFDNIINAEVNHIEQLKVLFKSYNVTIPVDTANNLVPHPANIGASFDAGVTAEIDNIAMYETFLKQKLPDDIKATFTALRDASKGHLSAFEKKQ